jgi:chromosomal replication initiator protein
MVRRALCKIIKVAKELGKSKLLYKIKMENTYGNKQPFTVAKCKRSYETQNIDAPFKNLDPELKNPL